MASLRHVAARACGYDGVAFAIRTSCAPRRSGSERTFACQAGRGASPAPAMLGPMPRRRLCTIAHIKPGTARKLWLEHDREKACPGHDPARAPGTTRKCRHVRYPVAIGG